MPKTLLGEKNNEVHPFDEILGVNFFKQPRDEQAAILGLDRRTMNKYIYAGCFDDMPIKLLKKICKRLDASEEAMQRCLKY